MPRRAPDDEQHIERVVSALRPLRPWEPWPGITPEWDNQEKACREDIARSLREIAAPRPGAGEIRKKVAKLASDLAKARNAAKALPDSALSLLGLDEQFAAELERVRKASEQFSAKIPVKPTSGSTVDGERMLLAASKARHLMIWWTEKRVSTTDDSDYLRLAALLYKLATGKRANLKKPCARHLREIRSSLSATGEPKPPSWAS